MHLMTGLKGNSGKQDSGFPVGPVIRCFVIPSYPRIEQTGKNNLLDADWHTNLPQFQGAQPDNVCLRVKSSSFVSLGSEC